MFEQNRNWIVLVKFSDFFIIWKKLSKNHYLCVSIWFLSLFLAKGNLDNLFLIVMGIVVFLMQCGFAFLEAGSVRSKNTVNILIKNMLDLLIAGKVYFEHSIFANRFFKRTDPFFLVIIYIYSNLKNGLIPELFVSLFSYF